MSGKYKFLRKRLCVAGLVAASVFAGVAAPVAVNMANVEVAEAAGDDYPYKNESNASAADPWSFIKRQCTSFVAWRLRNTNGYTNFTNYNPAPKRKDRSGLYRWGHAYEWGSAARSLGITVDMNPSRGSVFWQNQGVNGAGNYGHVAWVDAVEGDYVWIEEYNYAGRESNYTKRNYDRRKVHKSKASGYIHIKDLIPPPPTPAPDINTYWPLENGYYTIKTAVGNRFLDVSGMGTANNVNIQIWDAFGAHSGQIYEVARNGNGTGYYIKNINSGKFVDAKVYNKNAKNGDNVEQYQGDGSNAQQYRLEDAGNGHFYIKNLYNKYLDVAGWVDANGTNVQLWDKADINAQKWKFTRVSGKNLANIADGDYMIYSKVGNKVLNASGNKTGNGTNLEIWDPNTCTGNIFTVQKDGRFVTKIKSKAANRMVDSCGGTNAPENVQLWDYNNGYGQNWYVEDAGDGYVYIRNLWGYYLDVDSGVDANGRNVNTWYFRGSNAQKWKFVKYSKPEVKDTRTGVYQVDGRWIYLKNGKHDTSFTGVAKSSKGNWIFVRNGVYDTYFTGVAKSTKGNWIYVNSGRYDAGFTGVAKSTKGNWIFVRNGRYDAGFTGVAKSTKGNWIYVKNGRYDTSFTGVAKSTKGNRLYIVKGRWQNTYTGKYQNYKIKNGYVI